MRRRANRSRYVILACLSLRPMSGYDVKKFLETTLSHFWSESYGQIYPTLSALQADGLVMGHARGGRERRVYRLTPRGLKVLRGWLREPAEPEVPRYEISLKLFFAEQLPLDETREHLRHHRRRHQEQLERYREHEHGLCERMAGSPRLPYRLAVLRGGIRYATMVVAWCDETLASLERLDPAVYPRQPGETGEPA